ncbi:MAG: hypothetical protein QOE09_2981 [Ilumatobacteraceae bacterium]|jgi:hypothetical protein
MKNAMVSVGLVGLLLASCGSDGTSSQQTSVAESNAPSSTVRPTETSPPPTSQPTETSPPPPPTAGPTSPSGPPVFDPQAIGSYLMLPSFILTVTVDNTNNGQLNETVTTTGFIKDPISVSEVATFSYDGTTDGTRSYLVGGRSYKENNFGDWYLYEAGSPEAPSFTERLDSRSGALAGVLSAQLAGQEDYEGIPANHFVFHETDLYSYASYTPENPGPAVEGDFYLAQEGAYVLYAHSKETSPGRTYEVTEALSSVGQMAEITLPADMAPMAQALDIGVDLGSLLPPGAALSSMIRYQHGIGVDYYKYKSPVPSNDEFLNFYRTLAPTNGWTVSHIGHIKLHLEPINCETSIECVILNNGGEQVVVSFGGGGITVEYDRKHVFSPL